ncbi:hypothetical protein V8B55DRAFT_1378072 [Mucor lusitanicus]|uniref:NmrA-like domain-containing protein n=2 Tax=Mucor circinelloides f. lusitanicus TaxID=29924 RepID=A0A168I8B2_MUCCL|nr:hypothetical protein FB192DRAFT_1342909 [Mucor lusitanicus]OAC99668.1 hypothetical protein MUCCIDRAFT_167080 [Mucor lusitanicus CBS 277.49]
MKNCILITNVDSLLGYALSYRFLEEWNRERQHETTYAALRDKTEFRLLCRERQGLEDLELLGAKIIEVADYTNKDKMKEFMDSVGYVMFLPENSSQTVKEGETVIECAKEQGVDYVTMLSYMGAEHAKDSGKHLHDYRHLEKCVSQHFNHNSYCVMRSAMWHQFYYYYGPMIEDKNRIQLPVHEKAKFGSIDLTDLVDAVYNLSAFPEQDSDDRHVANLAQLYTAHLRKKNKTLFEFTPRHNITPRDLVQSAADGLERKNMTYEKVGPETLYDYLRRIHNDNRFRQRPIQRATDIVEHQLRLKEDRPYTFPLGRYLNDCVIEGILEYWEMADAGKEERSTDDLEKAIGRHPTTVDQFFKNNRDQFDRLR